MTFINTIADRAATAEVAELFEADRADLGYVANCTRVLAHRPKVFEAWEHLNEAIKDGVDIRRYELATVAAARQLQSSYCALAHGKVLADRFLGPEAVRELLAGHPAHGVDAVDVAVMNLAERVVADATSITQADIDHLRGLGLSDTDILDTVLAAAVRCFFSKVLDALGVQPDAVYAELEPNLRDALTVGRPIEDT